MAAVPEWMRPPRPEGWCADDLDKLPDAPRHTELIDGALVFMMSPRRVWHARLVTALVNSLTEQAPPGVEVDREITIRLDRWNRPEPDLLAAAAPYDPSEPSTRRRRRFWSWRWSRRNQPTATYVPTAIHRSELRTTTPFAITLDLDGLVPGRKG